jgi:hypothetical protein
MDNSMSNNNIEVNNSISNLSFLWISYFLDGSIIEQLKDGVESRFQLVKNNFDKLIRFSLVNRDYSKCFTVDLQKGFIIYNNFTEFNNLEEKSNIRLIYFRRNTITMTESGEKKSHTIIYHVGLQWNDTLGNNRKIILKIDSAGNFIVIGE